MTQPNADLIKYIRNLVDIPSVTGDEGALAGELQKDLTARGFAVEMQEAAPGRWNVYARDGSELPRVVLCTHLDTVPPFYASSEDEDYIYGRGSCDAKGVMSAMIFAATALRAQDVRDVGLLFVVGEEVDSLGALAANALESRAKYVVVGEPTENKMASGHKGGFKIKLSATGKAAHSAYPQLGSSAIEKLLDVLATIRATDWGRSDVLGEATVNIGTISGGLAANVIPPDAEAEVFVRVVGKAAEVQKKLDALLAGKEAVSYDLVSASDAVFCETRDGFEVAPVSFGTDIPSLTEFGKPLLLGPGSIHDAHTSGEKIGKQEATEAVEYYQRLVKDLLAES